MADPSGIFADNAATQEWLGEMATSIDAWFCGLAGEATAADVERIARSVTDLSWRLLHPASDSSAADSNASAERPAPPRRSSKTSSRKKGRSR